MSLLSDFGRNGVQSFKDWVNADSLDIPPEIVFPPKPDDHGHGHDDHGHGDHGHDDHGHGDHGHDDHGHDAHCEEAHDHGADAHEAHAHEEHAHEAHAHEDHGHEDHGHDEHGHHEHLDPPCVPQPSRAEAREALWKEINEKDEEARKERAEKVAAAAKRRDEKAAAYAAADEDYGVPEISRGYHAAALICGLILAAILLVTVASLPHFGSDSSPAVNEVSRRYLESGVSETGAINAVAGIILDYRAFDTLGESVVLFTATVTVLFLLKQCKRAYGKNSQEDEKEHYEGMRSLPARVVFGISIPFILLYGIYVVVNGHLSPGGGFSGGTILGAAFVLSHLVFGEKYTERFITVDRCSKIMAAGLFVYIGLKTYHVLTGANGIESGIPLGVPGSIFSAGLIFPLNICVGLVVACTIFSLYNLFSSSKI